jgi:hypothetical protein
MGVNCHGPQMLYRERFGLEEVSVGGGVGGTTSAPGHALA